ncbi:HindIII family type II restriction endonuclease [Dehalococcoidia bacterium]|nr:HindIII family type II restriction endonuclease [Dehalococcoidia bacterium]
MDVEESMKHSEAISRVIELSGNSSLSFPDKANQLEAALSDCSIEDILEHLDYAGVIPECFEHDSTEEKLYAKYCDALLARALTELGLRAEMIAEHSGAADVRANADTYQLVGDAKAFRLSRTAKNQKDFKVGALNEWREGADYACLVAPFYQYPSTNSQIYSQAIQYNVTLLSYTHIVFMLRSQQVNQHSLMELWQIGQNLRTGQGISQRASSYWSAILRVVLKITGKLGADWESAVEAANVPLREQAREQIRYWEEEKKRLQALDQKSAVKQLIKALKIDTKIQVVRRTAGM